MILAFHTFQLFYMNMVSAIVREKWQLSALLLKATASNAQKISAPPHSINLLRFKKKKAKPCSRSLFLWQQVFPSPLNT